MNKVLFLDRDGIINVDSGYVHKIEDFHFMPDIFNVCKHAQQCGYLIIVITNQSGIARGYYTERQFELLSQWMVEQFNLHNINIADVLYCPHHPVKGQGEYKKMCNCRKPEPGMLFQAQKKFNVDMQKSIFIGDKDSDIAAAHAAGINNRILFKELLKDKCSDSVHNISTLNKSDDETNPQLITKKIILRLEEAINFIS